MSTAEAAATTLIEARKSIKPAENAFMEIFRNYLTIVKNFTRENKWYSSSNVYTVMGEKFYHINDIEINEGAKEITINVSPTWEPFGEDLATVTYDELDNPLPYLEEAFAEYKKAREAEEESFKKARKKALLAELKDLED